MCVKKFDHIQAKVSLEPLHVRVSTVKHLKARQERRQSLSQCDSALKKQQLRTMVKDTPGENLAHFHQTDTSCNNSRQCDCAGIF